MNEIIEKVIYAKRKGLTRKELGEIFEIEINHHLRNHPHLKFLKIGEPEKKQDQSTVFKIYFQQKPVTTP